jgi:DNA-directed RNA polymerase alpha subunit
MPKSVAAQRKVDLSKYDKLGGEWKKIGLSAPARRALVNAKLTKIEHLKKLTEKQLMSLHGMGPSSLPIIKKAMKKYKVNFKL